MKYTNPSISPIGKSFTLVQNQQVSDKAGGQCNDSQSSTSSTGAYEIDE